MMPSSHLSLCHPLLLLPPIPPSITVFSSELTFHMRWPKYWSFSFSISPSYEHPGLISCRRDWLDLLAWLRHLKFNLSQFWRQEVSRFPFLWGPSPYLADTCLFLRPHTVVTLGCGPSCLFTYPNFLFLQGHGSHWIRAHPKGLILIYLPL